MLLNSIRRVFSSRAGTRGGNNGVYARSEAELEQIMDGLHEQEVSFSFCHFCNSCLILMFVMIPFEIFQISQ